jgi:hypothetical protein
VTGPGRTVGVAHEARAKLDRRRCRNYKRDQTNAADTWVYSYIQTRESYYKSFTERTISNFIPDDDTRDKFFRA